MKKLFIIVVLSQFTTNSFAQSEGFNALVPKEDLIIDSLGDATYYKRGYKLVYYDESTITPGTELNLYYKHYTTGTTLTIIGGALMGVGGLMLTNDVSSSFLPTFTIGVGSILILTGYIFHLEAPIHIKKAALILNAAGVGLTYKL